MNKTIRLTESKLRNMIAKSVNNTLNEMATTKQIGFLRNLLKDRYKPEYDNLPVSKASEMIDAELQRQKAERNSGKASPKQIDFIENNKYYSIPSIRTIADRLTKEDANALVSALNPYTNGMYTYYGHARQRKEQWLPQMKDIVVPILEKYGLSQEAQDVASYVDTFMDKFNTKAEKKAKKAKQERFEKVMNGENTLFFVSTQDEENVGQHECERLTHELYMDGVLEQNMHWDIPYLVTDMTKYTMDTINDYVRQLGVASFPAIVIGYEGVCTCVLWRGFDLAYRPTICGRLVDESEASQAYRFAKENLDKQANGASLRENKLKKIIKESVRKILKESVGTDDFSIRINKLYSIVKDCCGSDSIRDCIASWIFDFDNWDNESKIVPCRYNKRGMYNLLYILTDYDLISTNQKTVDIKNSNHPDIAKLIKPYVDSEMCSRVYEYFTNF